MKTRKAKGKQETLRNGSLTATLYHAQKKVGAKTYPIFRLVYVEPGGGRKVRDFGSRDKAKEVWETVSGAYALGRPGALSFTRDEQSAHDSAVKALARTGVGLYEAALQFASAFEKLPPGVTLAEAVGDFSRRHPAGAPKKSVAEVVQELVADRTAGGCSAGHLRDIPQRLNPFAVAFSCPIGSVTAPMVRNYLKTMRGASGQAISLRSQDNARRHIVMLFNFARKQQYIGRELAEEVAEIEAPQVRKGKVEIFTPGELAALLSAADDADRPLLAIGAFAGLRTSELQRLNWTDFRMGQGVLILDPEKTKTFSRRVVPIQPNLAEWLAPHVQPSGRLSRHNHESALAWSFGKTGARAGIPWKKNALRHSFCTYRLAVAQDAPKVAFEAGNSPAIIARHYLELATEADGKRWFAIRPAQVSNVIQLNAGGVA